LLDLLRKTVLRKVVLGKVVLGKMVLEMASCNGGQHFDERKSIYRPSATRVLVRAASPEFPREGCCRLRREPFRPHELFRGTRNNASLAIAHRTSQATHVSPWRALVRRAFSEVRGSRETGVELCGRGRGVMSQIGLARTAFPSVRGQRP
jgi:hypothetical protein